MFESLYEFGIDLILSLQTLDEWVFAVMRFFTALGSENFYLLVMPAILWVVDYGFGLRFWTMLLLTGGVNSVLKVAFHQPRPFWVSGEIRHLSPPELGFGVPSGHSQIPLSVYGLAAATLKRAWVTAGVVVLVLLIGLSRVVLGMHFPQDVVIGWAVGLIVLWAFLRLEKPVRAWFEKHSTSNKILLTFLLSILIILTGVGVTALVEAPLPQSWIENANAAQPNDPIDPYNLEGIVTIGGSLFGMVLGALWTEKRGGFDAGGPWGQRALRILVGVAGVVVFWRGLALVFPESQNLVGFTFRYVRYTAVGFWVTGLAVWVFGKLRLTTQTK